MTQINTHKIMILRISFYKHWHNFQHNHLDFQMPELCSVKFVDIYMALYCHTQASCSVVMNATSRKHVTVLSFGNFNRFCVMTVNGGQWIEFYLTISSCNTNVLVLVKNSILHNLNQIKSCKYPQRNCTTNDNQCWKKSLMCETF